MYPSIQTMINIYNHLALFQVPKAVNKPDEYTVLNFNDSVSDHISLKTYTYTVAHKLSHQL